MLAREGYPLRTIEVASLKDKSLGGKIRGLLALPGSLWQSGSLLRFFHPDLVLGVGGYASGPVVLTAWAMGYKTAIQEQNAFPGLSNRILGWFVDRIFISFPDSARHFHGKKTILTGNPVRKRMSPGPSLLPGKGKGRFHLLIFGGSQGAHRLNLAMVEALEHLRGRREKLRVIHQTGERDFAEVQAAYEKERFAAEVQPFIEDMERAYAAADLVVCRAGATSLFELMAMGKPAILVPYPYAANDHQTLNAQSLVRSGAALMVPDRELTGRRLGEMITRLIEKPERLHEMGTQALALAKPEAAGKIVDLCYEMIQHG